MNYIAILAAGKGVRMKSYLPKVLHRVSGKEMILWVIDSVKKLGKIFVIVGHKKELVLKILPENAIPVIQKKQLGTGHAVLQLEKYLCNKRGNLLVLCGDVPLIRKKTIRNLIEKHKKNKNHITVLATYVPEPKGYGRIIEKKGELLKIIEEKNASPEVRKIKKINAGIYVFKINGLFKLLKKIKLNPVKKEYYLTDIIEIAKKENKKVGVYSIKNYQEVLGVNTREELKKVEGILKKRRKN